MVKEFSEESAQQHDTTDTEDQRISEAIEEVNFKINAGMRSRKVEPATMLRALQYALDNVDSFSQSRQQVTDISIDDLINGYWTQVAKRVNCAGTGFGTLDQHLGGGYESKRLVVVLGAPNCGKTTFVHQSVDSVADSGRPVLYVTSEDSPHDLLSKTLARLGNIKYTAVQKGWPQESGRIKDVLAMQSERTSTKLLRYLDADSGVTLHDIKDIAKRHFASHPNKGHGVLVVDYLQRLARMMRSPEGKRQELRELVTDMTNQLRDIAKELDCCVIAIASQNRASGYNASNSALASAKESGDVEYTADVIIALGDDTKRTAPAGFKAISLRIDKNRQGGKVENIQLDFQPDRQMFTEADR